VDFRLVLLLIIAVIFLYSAAQKSSAKISHEASIEGDFIDFDYAKVFNLPSGEFCLEESSLPYRSQAL
jgi:hypothetical protein